MTASVCEWQTRHTHPLYVWRRKDSRGQSPDQLTSICLCMRKHERTPECKVQFKHVLHPLSVNTTQDISVEFRQIHVLILFYCMFGPLWVHGSIFTSLKQAYCLMQVVGFSSAVIFPLCLKYFHRHHVSFPASCLASDHPFHTLTQSPAWVLGASRGKRCQQFWLNQKIRQPPLSQACMYQHIK